MTDGNSGRWPRPVRVHPGWLPVRQVPHCPHPGELSRRVTTTHPGPMDANSTAGERKVTVKGGFAIAGVHLEAGPTTEETLSVAKSANSHRFTG